jgi:hypothetical protein
MLASTTEKGFGLDDCCDNAAGDTATPAAEIETRNHAAIGRITSADSMLI